MCKWLHSSLLENPKPSIMAAAGSSVQSGASQGSVVQCSALARISYDFLKVFRIIFHMISYDFLNIFL